MADSIVVKAKIKEVVKSSNVGGDFADGLNDVLIKEIKKAAERADGNGRKTVQAKDVMIGKYKTEPMVVVRSKVKSSVSDMNTSSDLAEAVNTVAIWLIEQAEERAAANNRKTIMAKDL